MPPEENKVEETKVEEKKVEEKKPDYESAARAEGWRPKEELGPDFDPAKFIGAEEFIKRKPLFDTLKDQKKEIRELKKTIESVVAFSEKNAQLATKRAIAELKVQRKEAIKAGDADAVETLDTTIKEHEKVVEDKGQEKPSVAPEIVEWTKTNDWFNKDMELQDFAVAYCASYTKAHPAEGMDKALEMTARATKRAFPDSQYFKEKVVKREDPPVVETHKGDGGGDSKKKYTVDRLNAEQKLAYKAYVKDAKMMTHDQYFQKLEEINALEA
jgi:hypothetical protein